MTSNETFLCQELINEHFGEIVSNVARYLCHNGWQSFRFIVIGTKLKPDQVRKGLCVLIQHKLATFRTRKHFIEYKADIQAILNMIYYPRMIYNAKLLYGDFAELIVEEILHLGIALMSVVLKRVLERLQDTEGGNENIEKAQSVFNELVKTHFLQREPMVQETTEDTDDLVPTLTMVETNQYLPFNLSKSALKRRSDSDEASAPQAKRQKTDETLKFSEKIDDDGIYWSINFKRFEQFFRDQTIVKSITYKHGAACGEIVRAMLRISEVTTPANAIVTQMVASSEICRSLPRGYNLSIEHIKQYLKILSADSDKIVELFDDSGSGGCYVINLKNAAHALATTSLLSFIQERYGSKSCRIFRLLMMKKHLEQKQVEQFAMIPGKEAKECLYNMLGENMLVLQEVPRTPDHAPLRTIFLFAVNIQRLTHMTLLRCYKSISNLMIRKNHEIKTSKRLLEKQEKISAIKDSLLQPVPEQLEEIDDMMTSNEKARLTKHEHSCDKLQSAQLQVSDTALVLNNYISFLRRPPTTQSK